MISDMQGIALVVAAVGSAVSAVLSARGKVAADAARASAEAAKITGEAALLSIKSVKVEFNGKMEKFMAVKDELADVRVEGSYKQGRFDQKQSDESSTK
jgi:hypothetical protein